VREASNANATSFDWDEWLNRLNLTLIKESPSPAIAACLELAPAHTPSARKLFNPAYAAQADQQKYQQSYNQINKLTGEKHRKKKQS
jgi:hypothetical protein